MRELRAMSLSQFADLLAIEPSSALRGVRYDPVHSSVTLILECDMQTTGTCPPISDNIRRKPTKKGKR